MTAPAKRISRQLMRMVLLTCVIVIAFTCTMFVTYEAVTFKQSVVRQLEILGQAIARNSTAALAFDNPDDARAVLAAFSADPHIVAAALYDESGALFAFYPGTLERATLPAVVGTGGYNFVDRNVLGFEDVSLDGQKLGTLFVKSDLKAIDERLELYALITLLVVVLSVLLAYLVARHQQSQISRPILALAETARAVSDGHDYSVRAGRAGTYEFDQLTDAFNHMLTQIQESERRSRAQMGRMSLLQHITAAIGDRHDLQSIFQVVLRNVEENLPIDFGCVCLYDSASATLTVSTVGAASRGLAEPLGLLEGATVPIDENGLSTCIRGRLVHEPDVRELPFPFPRRFAEARLYSLVIAPLLVEASVFGVFVAARHTPHSFSSGDCEFLKQLSGHVALASHQARLHGALRQAYDELRQSQHTVMQQERLRALGQMASGIAHDINNAISPISLYTDSLLEREPNLTEKGRAALVVIQRAIDGVAGTVSRMREFYRQREPEMTLALVDLNRVAEQVLELTRAKWFDVPQQLGISIDLKSDLAPGLPGIMGAEGEIRDALTNLIFNAVDAMPAGGTLTVRTFARPAPGETQLVRVEVTDTGIGMDEETRRRCLEPFFTTKGERGTGLGLAMVYGMIQRHSAEFEIESFVGKGTSMQVTFPAYTQPLMPATRSPEAHVSLRRLRVLLVDDDPIIIKALEDALTGDGHATVAASGGQAGIDAFSDALRTNHPFELVVTDLGMPSVDGRRVAESIKSRSPDTPVIMLTGWGTRMIAEKEIPPHVDRVLGKPPRLVELRVAIRELLG
ncbi:MAG TPA: ATP-binding protein [Steroidobacteraceae bacterium]|nr:ATP-binding protein [Steroidobacteraceae bacterium]